MSIAFIAVLIFGVEAARASVVGDGSVWSGLGARMQLSAVFWCVGLLAVAAVQRCSVRRWLASRSARVALALGAGVVLAVTPVGVRYDDGCNRHGSELVAVGVPFVLAFKPATPWLAYSDGSTQASCSGDRIRLP